MNFSKFSYLVLSITIIILTTSISAQSDSTTNKTTSLKAGSWSLQFGYNDNLSFNSFKGGNISAKYHYTDKSALRFGVDINSFHVDQDGMERNPQTDSITISNGKMNQLNIGLTTDYLYYFSILKPVNLFISTGATVGIGFDNYTVLNTISGVDSVSSTKYRKINNWFVGAEFSIGVEWFVTKNFSLHGEFITDITYQYRKDRNNYSQYYESISKVIQLSPGRTLIGVSLYF